MAVNTAVIALPSIAVMRLLIDRPAVVILQDGSGLFYWVSGITTADNGVSAIACKSGPAGRYLSLQVASADNLVVTGSLTVIGST